MGIPGFSWGGVRLGPSRESILSDGSWGPQRLPRGESAPWRVEIAQQGCAERWPGTGLAGWSLLHCGTLTPAHGAECAGVRPASWGLSCPWVQRTGHALLSGTGAESRLSLLRHLPGAPSCPQTALPDPGQGEGQLDPSMSAAQVTPRPSTPGTSGLALCPFPDPATLTAIAASLQLAFQEPGEQAAPCPHPACARAGNENFNEGLFLIKVNKV